LINQSNNLRGSKLSTVLVILPTKYRTTYTRLWQFKGAYWWCCYPANACEMVPVKVSVLFRPLLATLTNGCWPVGTRV